MLGRAAQGRPWLFHEISHFLATGEHLAEPQPAEILRITLGHMHALYDFYGEYTGLRVARKHISWYTKGLVNASSFRHRLNHLETVQEQLDSVDEFFSQAARASNTLQYDIEPVELAA